MLERLGCRFEHMDGVRHVIDDIRVEQDAPALDVGHVHVDADAAHDAHEHFVSASGV